MSAVNAINKEVSRHIDLFAGCEFSNPLSDGTVRRLDSEASRRRVDCQLPKAEGDIALCVAAWHGVLHWLRYDDEPILTLLLNDNPDECWPIVTEIAQDITRSELYESVNKQWPEATHHWLALDGSIPLWLEDQLRCHVIRLIDIEVAKCDRAELEIIRTTDGWVVDCAVNRFTAAYQKRLCAIWRQFVNAIKLDPDVLLSAPVYRQDGGADWEVSGPVVHLSGNLVKRFALHVEKTPTSMAVKDENASLTYRQLDERSSAWAYALEQSGAQLGTPVGVCFQRNLNMVIAQLAVLKAGGVFIPMDSEQPQTRLESIVEDSELKLVLTEQLCAPALNSKLPQTKPLVCETISYIPTGYDFAALNQLAIDDLAYVIFTSGSTGRPKGVKVTHGNLLNFVTHIQRYFGQGEILSQFAPFTFDASVAEIHSAILNGVPLVILSGELINNPDKLQEYMTAENITFAAFPPEYAKHLSPQKVPHLRTLLTAGSAPDLDLVRRWQPHVNYVNAYGPTETTILSTAWDVKQLPSEGEPIVIGSPISNTDVRVVNRFGHALPEGMIGELLIGGAGVSKGYLKRKELNETAFLEEKGNRWYRSGDLSYRNNDKEIIFAGRVDSQIKVRGHRLEPGEVESAFNSLVSVEHSAAVAVKVNGLVRLIAFCQGAEVAESTLREQLQSLLPEWAIPNRIFWLSALPLTVNGKIDYRALKSRAVQFVEADKQAVEFVDETEAQVAEIWKNVLGLAAVAREDNFIHLGGDSLTSLVVMSALKRLGYIATSSQLLAHPKLADFAGILRQQDTEGARRYSHNYDSCTGSAPLSPIQGWFFDLDLPNPNTFCQTLIFDARPTLDPAQMQKALERLVQYHDELRACFAKQGASAGRPLIASQWQQIIEIPTLELPAISVTQATNETLSEATEQMRLSLAKALDIEQAPLFRMAILQTLEKSRVVWVIHHLITDTISHGVLLDDLYHLYHGGEKSVEDLLPGKSISYFEWTAKLLGHVDENADTMLAQWQPVLDASVNADSLPLTGLTDSQSLSVEYCTFTAEQTKLLIEQAGDCYRQSAEELVLAAVYMALAKAFNLQRIGIDVEWHGRDEAFAGPRGIDRSVGWFTSVHPLFISVPNDIDLGNWLVNLKEARAAVADRGRDFYALRYLSANRQVREAFGQYRAPQVLFNFSGVVQRSNQEWQTVPVVAIEVGEGNNTPPYALSVESEIRGNQLRVGLYLDKNVWRETQITQLQQAIRESLDAIIVHCRDPQNSRRTPSDFPLLNLSLPQLDQLPAKVRDVYPLTDMQQTMYRHERIYQVWMHYGMPRAFNREAFDKAVASWIDRHDCLRTVVKAWGYETIAQVVLADSAPSVEVHRIDAQYHRQYANDLINKDRKNPVSVTLAPPHKLIALDSGEDQFSVILSIHHIIHDGWSIEILLNDLFNTYRFFLGESQMLPLAPMASMKDVVVEQQRQAEDVAWRNYWEHQPWGDDYARLPVLGSKADTGQENSVELYIDHLDQALANMVSEASKTMGVTGNSVWLAAYLLLLRYLGGQRQVRCGVTQSGRPETIVGVESITGCCVNTLPMIVDIDASVPLQEIVKDVNRRLRDMHECTAFPLSHIHAMAKKHTDGEVFDTLFNIESGNYGQQVVTDKPTLLGGYESTNYEFVFGLIEGAADPRTGGGVGLRIGYDTGRYGKEEIIRWVDVYKEMVSLIADASDRPWGQLQPLPESMRKQLAQWNDTATEYPRDRCLHQLFEAQVEKTPETIAVVFEDRQLSYQELNARANRLAHHLRTLGVGPDVLVGLCVERSLEMVVGLLGILKAGGAYVPLDPGYPKERLVFMLEDSQATVLLTHKALQPRFADAAPKTICLDADRELTLQTNEANPLSGVRPDNLAYAIYTSGTTGLPKGVMISHRAIYNHMLWLQGSFPLTDSDKVLQKTPFSFDASVWEFYAPLLTGAQLIMARPGGHQDPLYLADVVMEQEITTLQLVPSLLQMLLEAEVMQRCRSLQRVFCGGEPLPMTARQRFFGCQEAELHNLYGPTEAAIDVASWRCGRDSKLQIAPLGRPVANTQMHILDTDFHSVPVGVAGEIFIGGIQLARGYLNRPELTAEKFIPNPFSDTPGERLYRTGDLARYLPDGNIEFLGRIDHQVKIRGFRIELGEIESAINKVEGINQVLVMARHETGPKQLVAYIVAESTDGMAKNEKTALIEKITAELSALLPDYMVPVAFIVMDKMPLNANGKIDRKRLPVPDESAYLHHDNVAPSNDIEQTLWNIWHELLGSSQFGVTDNFFSIGGDSILSIQIVSRALKQGLPITTRQMFEYKSIRALAQYLGAVDNKKAPEQLLAVEQVPVSGEQRLLPIQLHFLQGDSVDLHHYNQSALIDLPAGITRDALRAMLAAIVRRHDVLRLKFSFKPMGGLVRYHSSLLDDKGDALDALLREVDLSAIAAEQREQYMADAADAAQAGLNLERGQLVRWVWFHGAGENRLLWIMHHLIVDGVSWRILLKDFQSALAQSGRGVKPSLPAKTSSFQSWASHIYEYAHTPELQSEQPYWLAQLQQPSACLPFAYDDVGDLSEATTAHLRFCLNEADTRQLLYQANRCYDTQINDLLLSGLALSLSNWLNESARLRIDMEGHGREALFADVDISETVGWFTTIYPFVLERVEGDMGHQIQTVKTQLAAIPQHGIGYGLLSYITQDEGILDALDHEPSSQLVFNYLGQIDPHSENDEESLRFAMQTGGRTVSLRRQRRHPLGINGFVKDGRLQFDIDYNRLQFDGASIARLVDSYAHALQEIIQHCVSDNDGLLPSNFPDVSVSKAELNQLQRQYPSLADLYPVTPMQQGLVLYTSREPDSGAYLTQLIITLDGVDSRCLRLSWQTLLQRYDILRTAFIDLDQSALLQLVSKHVELPWRELDARPGDGEDEQRHLQRIDKLLNEERVKSFDVGQAPLMRLLLLRLGEQQYQLAWTHHHALLDGWSMGIIVRELVQIYAEISAGRPPSLPEAKSYRTYIQWLRSQDYAAAEAYWRDYLKDVEVPLRLTLPDSAKKSTVQAGQAAHTVTLSEATSNALTQLAKRASVTMSTVVQSAWSVLLSKYSGENQVLFGYAVSGRPPSLEGVENMVGLFINSLPMRVSLQPDLSVEACLQQVQRQQIESADYHYVSLADMQAWCGLRADQSLFDSLVVIENYPLDETILNAFSAQGLIVRDIRGVEQNDFALNLVMYPGERLTFTLVYNTATFADETTEAMLSHFCEILTGISKGVEQPLSALCMLSPGEIQRATNEWNDTAMACPRDKGVYALFSEQVSLRGDATALVMGDTRWSYPQLAARATVVSEELQRVGVKTGAKVAVSLPKSPDLVAALLGIMRIGAAYVPIAVDCPPDRFSFMVGDAQIKHLVTRGEYGESLALEGLKALCLDTVDSTNRAPKSDAIPDVDPQSTAYVIYTSGTTGQPKGVAISHQNLINFCYFCQHDAWCEAGDAVTQFAPYTFDASVGETFAALLAGAELHLLSEPLMQDPAAVSQYLVEHNIRHAAFPPPYLQQMDPEIVPPEITILTAGSAPTLDLVKRWGAMCHYVNAYGPTEATILSSCWHYQQADVDRGKFPIGEPVANTQIYILDQYGQLCPAGVIGEICIGGDGVVQGYLNQEALTAQQFVKDPWREGGRLYRTGDLGRWLSDGNIEFVGRKDHQVKIRGFRIELSEIEHQLEEHPAIQQAVVLVKGERADKRLFAWVTPKSAERFADAAGLIGSLRASLRRTLPDYMVPQGFVVMDQLPVTANGKVDKKALQASEVEALFEGTYVAPRNDVESRLVTIWSMILGLKPEQISVTANFFEMGGHSLLATRLVNEITRQMGVRVPVRWVFEHNTIEATAQKVQEIGQSDLDAIQPADRSQPLPLSFTQQRLWFIDQLDGGGTQYNQPFALHLQGAVDKTALQQAFNAILERHEILRTVYVATEQQPRQKILESMIQPVTYIDVTHLDSAERDQKIKQIMVAEAAKPFDLSSDLMIRVSLVKAASSHYYLLLTLHHIASDGWSVSVLMNEITAAYRSLVKGEEVDLPPLPVQYADFAHWQRNHLQGEVLERQLRYWRDRLKGLPLVHGLPLDKPRPRDLSYNGKRLSTAIGVELTHKLRELGQTHQATLFMVLHAACSVLLSRYSGQSDIVVGTTVANRDHEAIEKLIGFFVNTLVLRSELSSHQTFSELLNQCRMNALDAFAHQQLPFDQLVDDLQPERSLSYNPVFQIMLSMNNVDQVHGLTLGDIKVNSVQGDDGVTAQFDLTIDVDEVDDHLAFHWVYATDIFETETIAKLAAHFNQLLEAVVSNPSQLISEYNLLLPGEWQQLVEWNANETEYPQDRCIHQLFEAQVERTPEAAAVIYEDRSLTYRELNSRANQLAHHLRSLGVGPDVVVGICIERSLEMVVGLLGILKAGGAYVPLDPAYPRERLAFMLEDSQASVLVTQKGLLEALPAVGPAVVCLDQDWQTISRCNEKNLVNHTEPEHLAYVIYTSGSTGRPKGVAIQHLSLINHVKDIADRYCLVPTDRVLQFASISFDVSAEEIYPTLLIGATLVLRANAAIDSADVFTRYCGEQRISVLNLPTAFWQEWARGLDDGSGLSGAIRLVIIGGERALPQPLMAWNKHFGNRIRLINAYGPTEGTITATCYDVAPDLPIGQVVPIGRPIANTQAYVLDNELQPVPVGVPGELYIGGAGLARGYLNRPELTAEKFIPNPFSTEPGARVYKTGDLVRYLSDGNIEFLDRIDHQVKIRGFRIELGEIETILVQHSAVRETVVSAHDEGLGDKRLVAYVVATPEAALDVSALRAFVKQRLPEYMVPSAFVFLDALPLNANGKVERNQLPEPDMEAQRPVDYVAPQGEVERLLSGIWAEVLRIERVGIHDNFFALGGDSILSLQVVARANQAGLQLVVRQLFEHQTVAGLAAVAGSAVSVRAEQGKVTGPVPFTPIQRWFFEANLRVPQHYNQSVLLEVRESLNPTFLESAIQSLLEHHDALRMRFHYDGTGWRQVNAADETQLCFTHIDLSSSPTAGQAATLEATAGRLQASLNLEAGPLMRVALFDFGADAPNRLLLVIHHLVVDGVSWRILVEDLQTVYRQLEAGQAVALPRKTTSFKQWAERLQAYARLERPCKDIDHWLAVARKPYRPLPVDTSGGANSVATTRIVTVSLTTQETQALLQQVPEAYRTQINDLLLTALAQTVSRWSGIEEVWVDLEGHGRESLFDDLDLTRTVGWFTTVFPVPLKLSETTGSGEAIKAIKEQLRAVPLKGLGYGVLRYLTEDPELRAALETMPQPQISFNYLGQFNQVISDDALYRLGQEGRGPERDENAPREYLFDIDGRVVDGALSISWSYSAEQYRAQTVEALAQGYIATLRGLIAHCLSPEAGGYTPSDFPEAALSQDELDRLVEDYERGGGDATPRFNKKNIEAIYPLSPMQQGMLFHSLLEPESGVYVEQLECTFQGKLDVPALERAWQRVVDAHAVLRTGFFWEHIERPLQIVNRVLCVSPIIQDWRCLTAEEQARRWERLLADDRRRDFELTIPPLMRLVLVQTADECYRFVWSHHHVLLDGWSSPVILSQIFAYYAAFSAGETLELEAPRPYRDYIAWLQGQDFGKAEAHWRELLAGFAAPTPLTVDRALSEQPAGYAEDALDLSAETTAALNTLVQGQQLTLSTLLLGAWAVLLSRYSATQDIVFGVTVSGRPAALSGVEDMVGLFINTLPVRVEVAPHATLSDWLQVLQAQNVALLEYQYSPLAEVQGWSEVPGGMPLFESIVVFENYPVNDALREQSIKGLTIQNVCGHDQTNYPLTLSVEQGASLSLRLSYDQRRFDASNITRLLGHLRTLLEGVVANPEVRLTDLSLLTTAERQQLLAEWNDTVENEFLLKSWPELFADRVRQTPDRVVAMCGADQLSYRQLDQRSSQLAHALKARGVGRDNVVALLDHRGIDLLVTIVGVLKAGAAYLPLDPAQPNDRWLTILTEGQPKLLLAGKELRSELDWVSAHWNARNTVHLSDLEHEGRDQEGILSYPGLDDLAYIIYTSGSTGKPKGVMIEHRGMINNMLSKVEPLALSEHDVIAQTASQGFDISVWQFLMAPLLGAKLSIVPDELTRDPSALLARLQAHEVSVWEPVPSVMQAALTTPCPLSKLRWVLPTGEALTAFLVARWFAQYPGIPLMNAYGPAECSDDVCFEPIHGPVERVLIGKPVANAHLHVVDEQLNLVPIGVVGELAVSGPVVGRGYLNAPELTQAVFKHNPYARYERDSRLYLSGDLVRRLPNGDLEYVGRKDFQVKIRGFRIELGEVEARMEECPGVKAAVAVARDNSAGVKQLVAYVVLDTSRLTVDELSSMLKSWLPNYMVPSVFVQMDALPLNANGKVERNQLPEPDMEAQRPVDYVAPQGEVEEAIAKVWRELLGVERVGRSDNFFNLGGNSILLVSMVGQLKKQNIELAVNDIYRADTLQACALLADVVEDNLPEWLAKHGITHQYCTVSYNGTSLVVLLIDKSQRSKHDAIKAVVAKQDENGLPDYIRYCDDLESTAEGVRSRGLKELPEWFATRKAIITKSLKADLLEYSTNLLKHTANETIAFSPMQQDMLQWTAREAMDWISVTGWYTSSDLQAAFGKLVAEQDMLHSVIDDYKKAWILLDADAAEKSIPVVDLRSLTETDFLKAIKKISVQMRKTRLRTRLPYLAVWISESDTKHHLIIVNDHLISDGACTAVFQTRLSAYLRGKPAPLAHRYRDYVRKLWSVSDQEMYDKAATILDLHKVTSCVEKTRATLQARSRHSLRVVQLEKPVHNDASAVEQAFNWFTHCVMQLTQLNKFAMAFNHHGRRLGEKQYFDHIGLFLDKVPFAVDADTSINSINKSLVQLERHGINYMALENTADAKQLPTCLDLRNEILFNFVGELSKDESAYMQLNGDNASRTLKYFNGILFEAYVLDGKLVIRVVFRGTKSDMKALKSTTDTRRNLVDSRELQKSGISALSQSSKTENYSLEIENARKTYGDFEAVKGVSFNVKAGCCFGILGPNGAGKTSLLSMIEGITPITSGSIRVLGMDVRTQIKQIQPYVGVQLQQNNYFQFLTVMELLKFYKEFRAANSRKVNGQSLDSLLERLNFQDKKNAKVDELSGGQKQRLSIAIALLEDPDVLFLDEPTSALDPHSRHHTWDFIEQLKQDTNKTIILTTHYMEEAERLCDELIIMNEGEIISQGTPAELVSSLKSYHEISLRYANNGFDTASLSDVPGIVDYEWDNIRYALTIKTVQFTDAVKTLLNLSEQQGLEIVHFDINKPTLEDVFLTRTSKGKEIVA